MLVGRTSNTYLSHREVKRVSRVYILEMAKVRGRKQTKGRTGKEDNGEGDHAGDCAGSTREEEKGIGRKRGRSWGVEAEGGEGGEGRGGGLSEGITGLPLNAKGPAGAQRGPTERRVGAP